MIMIFISFVIVNFVICKKWECSSKEIYNKIWLKIDLVTLTCDFLFIFFFWRVTWWLDGWFWSVRQFAQLQTSVPLLQLLNFWLFLSRTRALDIDLNEQICRRNIEGGCQTCCFFCSPVLKPLLRHFTINPLFYEERRQNQTVVRAMKYPAASGSCGRSQDSFCSSGNLFWWSGRRQSWRKGERGPTPPAFPGYASCRTRWEPCPSRRAVTRTQLSASRLLNRSSRRKGD